MFNMRIATTTAVVMIFTNRDDKETFITAIVGIVPQAVIIEAGQVPGMNPFRGGNDSLVSADFALLCTQVCFQHDGAELPLVNLEH